MVKLKAQHLNKDPHPANGRLKSELWESLGWPEKSKTVEFWKYQQETRSVAWVFALDCYGLCLEAHFIKALWYHKAFSQVDESRVCDLLMPNFRTKCVSDTPALWWVTFIQYRDSKRLVSFFPCCFCCLLLATNYCPSAMHHRDLESADNGLKLWQTELNKSFPP